MIYQTEFRLDEKRREILPSYSEEFPFSCLDVILDSFVGRGLHWHTALELDYVLEGKVEFTFLDNSTIVLEQGDAIFINSNIMHSAKSLLNNTNARIYAFLFGSEFITGTIGGLLEQKYVMFLYQNPNIPFFLIHPSTPNHVFLMKYILTIPKLAQEEDYGYEFEIRHILCKIWLILGEELKNVSKVRKNSKLSEDVERIKSMIQFIQNHYMDNINLMMIASAASLSERECNRCFQRHIHMTPISYLNSFRVRMAAQMLAHTDENIFVISDMCGFNSNSYFGRVFKETTGKTPLQYRSENQ